MPENAQDGVALEEVTLRWDAIEGVLGYSVFFYPEGQPERLRPLASGILENELSLPFTLELNQSYLWQVLAVFDTTCVTTTDEPWRFTTIREPFQRGDANADGMVDITDAIITAEVLYLHTGEIACQDGADSGDLGIVDVLRTLFYLFADSVDIPPPGPDACADDPTPDALDCVDVSACVSES
jgi:hypothetical protein